MGTPAEPAGKAGLAWLRAQWAMRRAFVGRLRYALDDGPRQKAGALSFLPPTISQALAEDEPKLEVEILDLKGAGDMLSGDWREAPAVEAIRCRPTRGWASQRIPAILDSQAVRLDSAVDVVFRPDVVRVLALPKDLRGA